MAENVTIATDKNAPVRPAAAPVDPVIENLRALFDAHKTAIEGLPRHPSVAQQVSVFRALSTAINTMLSIGTDAAFATGLSYVQKNKTGSGSANVALIGATQVDRFASQGVINVFLALMTVVNKFPQGVNVRSLQGVTNSSALLAFLSHQ